MKPRIFFLSLMLMFSSVAIASPVNINKASAEEIASALNGIGQSRAEAIVVWREHNGGFKNAEDIMQVKGIGKAIYEKNRKDILLK